MRKTLPILLCLLALSSCVRDDISNCAGMMHFHFRFMYGGTNSFFEMEKTDLTAHFYQSGSPFRYRDIEVQRTEISPNRPLTIEKTPEDTGSLEFYSWSKDPAVDYINTPGTPLGKGYVLLKEITEGSGICRPVDDLFYGHAKFHINDRLQREDIIADYVRAVCRIRITLIPSSVDNGAGMPGGIPGLDDYTFHILGTRNKIDDHNITSGDEVTLDPLCRYEEASGNIVTDWFGAFASDEGKYLRVKVFLRGREVAFFDCTEAGIASVPGSYIDLVIDRTFVRAQMAVIVNGWKVANITTNV